MDFFNYLGWILLDAGVIGSQSSAKMKNHHIYQLMEKYDITLS